MRIEIMGFLQEKMLELKMDVGLAMLLRWFVDFRATDRMKEIVCPEDKLTYYWVNYNKLASDLPIITKDKRWMADRFNKLVEIGLLSKYTKQTHDGKLCSYRLNSSVYSSLIASDTRFGMSVKTDMPNVGMNVNTDMGMSVKTDMLYYNENNNKKDNLSEITGTSDHPAGDLKQQTAIANIPLNDGTYYPITEEVIRMWQGLYPSVNVLQELNKMIGWCVSNPKRRKTITGANKFINRWLSKEQDKYSYQAVNVAKVDTKAVGKTNNEQIAEKDYLENSDGQGGFFL